MCVKNNNNKKKAMAFSESHVRERHFIPHQCAGKRNNSQLERPRDKHKVIYFLVQEIIKKQKDLYLGQNEIDRKRGDHITLDRYLKLIYGERNSQRGTDREKGGQHGLDREKVCQSGIDREKGDQCGIDREKGTQNRTDWEKGGQTGIDREKGGENGIDRDNGHQNTKDRNKGG